jgi:hypothetical protein
MRNLLELAIQASRTTPGCPSKRATEAHVRISRIGTDHLYFQPVKGVTGSANVSVGGPSSSTDDVLRLKLLNAQYSVISVLLRNEPGRFGKDSLGVVTPGVTPGLAVHGGKGARKGAKLQKKSGDEGECGNSGRAGKALNSCEVSRVLCGGIGVAK